MKLRQFGYRAEHSPPPRLSVVVVIHNMSREAPRTLLTLSAEYQRGTLPGDYEVIVLDHASRRPFPASLVRRFGANFIHRRIETKRVSPTRAINEAIESTRGELVAVMIDGARMLSPGIIRASLDASDRHPGAVVATLAWHLGSDVQMESVRRGYDQDQEDLLLNSVNWRSDGYQLFDISCLAGSSEAGYLGPINESNFITMPREVWYALGGYEERFQYPGGGLANLDLFSRCCERAEPVVMLCGEGTFHQVHGGVATNALVSPMPEMEAEFRAIRGRYYSAPEYDPVLYPNLELSAPTRSWRCSAV